jgi:predicted nucleic acid-binding protein
MARLLDTTLWVDLTRSKSPLSRRAFVVPYVSDSEARIAEPILFELLRSATDAEANLLTQYFGAIPQLSTPADLWSRASDLGRECRRNGISVGAIDLLIAQVALHHGAELVTFDSDFQRIAQVSGLQVQLLQRPTP